ncbi:NADH dehydrogenase [ubiquinone] 1 alpha subcomplex assembly factor 2-like isoform X1 [Argonauta hians]
MTQRARWLWGLFKNSMYSLKQDTRVIGKDHFGNTYYEKDAMPSRNLKGARWVEREDGDQMTAPDVPVEWEAWIRGKRKDPPTVEEIQKNHAFKMRTIQRAKELEQKYSKTSTKLGVNNDLQETIGTFPKYPEYEIMPGKKSESDNKN